MNEAPDEPDWQTPLQLQLTPERLMQALFWSASAVHTGWSSCIEPDLTLGEVKTVDEATGNWCRLVEQEFVEEGEGDATWHDWTVELRICEVYVVGHWQIPVTAAPMEWEWHAHAAEHAFDRACALFGRRTRKGVVVEELATAQAPPADIRRH